MLHLCPERIGFATPSTHFVHTGRQDGVHMFSCDLAKLIIKRGIRETQMAEEDKIKTFLRSKLCKI